MSPSHRLTCKLRHVLSHLLCSGKKKCSTKGAIQQKQFCELHHTWYMDVSVRTVLCRVSNYFTYTQIYLQDQMLRVGVMSRCNELVFQVHRRKKLKCKGQFVLHEEWHNNVKVVRLVAFWLYHFLQTKRACAHCPREVVHIRTSKPSCLGKCMAVHTHVCS